MAVSIRSILSTLPSGAKHIPLDNDEVAKYLRTHCDTEEDRDRNARHAVRDILYRDGGVGMMCKVIEQVIRDDKVRDLRKAWAKHTRFNNALKRIINEVSTVYSKPAERTVDGDANNRTYQEVLKRVQIPMHALLWGRLANLHRTLLVGFRVREKPDGSREPVLDIASPANVRALLHPNDDKLVVGWIIRVAYRTARGGGVNAPRWVLWTDSERVHLREDMAPIWESYTEHELGVCPWVPVELGARAAGFWPGEEGEDLVAAQMAIWFSNILLLKEEKSATKQKIISGDTSNVARGQASDTEVDVELGDGAAVNTVDMSMDLKMFMDAANHILESAGHNYGLSSAMIKHEGVQSAAARDLMRVPLTEQREQQEEPFRAFEEQLAVVMSAVLKVDMPELGFEPTGWRIKFKANATPLGRAERVDVFIKERTAGVTDTVEYIGDTEDMDPNQAAQKMARHVAVETTRNELMRPLAATSGSAAAEVPDRGKEVEEAKDKGGGRPPDVDEDEA